MREATADDLPRLQRLREFLPEPTPQLLEYAVDGPPLVLVSTAAGTPVGYALVLADGDAGYVAELVVEPAHRREGRARRLLTAAFDRLRRRGCSRVTLSVRPDADAARALYASLGFEERDREENYYADGADALVLGRDL
ncbi:GNAT family N-acetyltransferase [Halomicrococcus gelatinilyticus]|uniref:GNAT family N-acetyltransferase n=1 Tax=Halomicrococcus gelatinilyticus TaxID=1702103 RepID=UPI002E14E144